MPKSKIMMAPTPHKWEFRPRFRARAFGWRSQPAMQRLKEAVSEIKKVAKQDPLLGADGAVLLIERISPAFEQVDSSSGAIGSAVYAALEVLIPLIAQAPADDKQRKKWLERIWQAIQDDQISYIEGVGDRFGELCAKPEMASRWADELVPLIRTMWRHYQPGSFFSGTTAGLSCLLHAGRHQELLELLDLHPYKFWSYHQYGVQALAAMGKVDEAIAYARAIGEEKYSRSHHVVLCEEILLKAGRWEEAYRDYAIQAGFSGTRLSWYRAIAKKYPQVPSETILQDLIDFMPGDEGKWFATAKQLGLYELAIKLANASPADPNTLIRAARDFVETEPRFAMEAAVAALKWMAQGYGYELLGNEPRLAFRYGQEAAERIRAVPAWTLRVQQAISRPNANWVQKALEGLR